MLTRAKRLVLVLVVALSMALMAIPASANPGDGPLGSPSNITWETITWE